MRLWLTSFILLFGAAELWQWVEQASLPTPFFVLGGAFLAIASNYGKLSMPYHLDSKATDSSSKKVAPSQSTKAVSPATSTKSLTRPSVVSFEIQKPFKPGD
ncbi:hypothetical protein JOY44_00100 [Phormidium sp. CLA17]|uniref:hypothetical protein n=1 Tax=Leptolyngbya sp. Cla-17 TaxID=2803751 RepID=UPI001491335B|nr:hypothetical protein [Leptolyngbya sp. Cla-17]MBM0740056.1 hypothetical protein [Leptolyngbya sp. Cla-17]